MGREKRAEEALILLRSRLCNPNFIFTSLSDSPDSNYSKLKFIVSSSVTEACNNSVLLLGPRGCGKIAVLELVIEDLLKEYPDMILVASFDDNTQFMIAMLRECGLVHKTVIFVLDEFDLFAQGKQRLLYSLLDAMQSVTSQAIVIGVSCRLDADQLLEKRVRSRFSHRKLLFLPPSKEDLQRLLKHILVLPTDSSLPHDYVVEFNAKLLDAVVDFANNFIQDTSELLDIYQNVLAEERFKQLIDALSNSDSTYNHLLRFLFSAVSHMDLDFGFLSLENFKAALSSIQRQPKVECLKDCSVLELYILVCMRRLEVKEQESYNFNSVMKEYKSIHDSFQTSDYYARNVCLRVRMAFEHLLERELISFMDNRGHNQSVEFRPVKLLISYHELYQGLKSYRSCPGITFNPNRNTRPHIVYGSHHAAAIVHRKTVLRMHNLASSWNPMDGVKFFEISMVMGIASRHLLKGTRVPYTIALLILGIALFICPTVSCFFFYFL
ncbi:hypothetical protein TEA_021861 [Camellia sinensis var. sinensis]|uniref:Origin of replication complex subunit 4 n=1 Tax=Camellia sinensis var. sinensis TaxID=542762 RepID=A0A4S4EES9_CAMSN|nr:hypothetical protein TEA_021861 [Camellia sinensis var. sinensis]